MTTSKIKEYIFERNKMNNNEKTLKDFTKFCNKHPEYRFWQSLYAWVGAIGIGGIWVKGKDPFHWEGKDE